jgi:sugar lactone lactonase YvrE
VTSAIFCLFVVTGAAAADDFVNFESGHTRPLAMSPDGALLFAVNTADNRLSILDVDATGLLLAAEVPVGLEPVAVASRVNATTGGVEAWVVNHLSDSVSIVEINPLDLALSRVTRTLLVGDEPRDVVFGGTPVAKAFITTARRGQNLPPGLEPRLNDESVPRALVWAFGADTPGSGLGLLGWCSSRCWRVARRR